MSARGSITRRLRIGFVVFALALAGTAAFTVAAISRQDQTLAEQTRRIQPLQAANIELRENLARSQAGLYGYLLTGQQSSLDVYRDARVELTGSLARVRAARAQRAGRRHRVAGTRGRDLVQDHRPERQRPVGKPRGGQADGTGHARR